MGLCVNISSNFICCVTHCPVGFFEWAGGGVGGAGGAGGGGGGGGVGGVGGVVVVGGGG